MKELLDMFLTFARIGGFTFGGGYVIVTLMKKKFVDELHWIDHQTLPIFPNPPDDRRHHKKQRLSLILPEPKNLMFSYLSIYLVI